MTLELLQYITFKLFGPPMTVQPKGGRSPFPETRLSDILVLTDSYECSFVIEYISIVNVTTEKNQK